MPDLAVERNIRPSDLRRHYLLSHPFVFAVALVSSLGAFASLAAPDLFDNSGAVADFLPSQIEHLWLAWNFAGGMLLAAGMWHLSPRLEAAGLSLMAGAAFVNVLALTDVRGFGAVLYGGYSLAVLLGASTRAGILLRRKRVQ